MTFSQAEQSIRNAFTSDDWTINEVTVYPTNYKGAITQEEYLIYGVHPSSSRWAEFGRVRKQGILIVSIFTRSGLGLVRAYEIGDLLDGIFEGADLGELRFSSSMITLIGYSDSQPDFYRADYLIEFTT